MCGPRGTCRMVGCYAIKILSNVSFCKSLGFSLCLTQHWVDEGMHSVLPEFTTALLLKPKATRAHTLTSNHAMHADFGKGGPRSPPPSRAQFPRKLFLQS